MSLFNASGEKTKILTVTVFSAIILFLLSITALAETIRVEYSFERPQIDKTDINGQVYDRIVMPDAPSGGTIGNPAMPAFGADILIPYGEKITNIEILTEETINLGKDYLVEPVARPIPLSAGPEALVAPTPNPDIYNSADIFPAKSFEKVNLNRYRGYEFITLRLYPVNYVPQSGELFYTPKMTVIITTEPSSKNYGMFRGLNDDISGILSRVDNPEIAYSYDAAPKRGAKNYDMLIITTDDMAGLLTPLKDYHDTTGILTEIRTISDIGSNAPDDIRAYITDAYLNDGIEYVLIGADDDLIPAKDLYVASWDGTDAEIEYSMPGDIYFACLDGTYNYDGDAYWGEPTDGEGGGDVDLVAEVYIGRAAIGNLSDVLNFVNKTLQFLQANDPYLKNALMVGEHLGFGGISEYAGTMMDQMIDGSTADGYTTVGIPSELYSVDRLYDRDYVGNDWPAYELSNRINSGLQIINHLGHGNESSALKHSTSMVLNNFNNDDLLFLYSQACLSGHFDGTDCWAEYMHLRSEKAAFALVMNARYGWGSGYSTDGPSQRFDREFWDAVFNPAENKPQLGKANHDSKEDNLYRINESCMRWCYYEATLFGDPTLEIKIPSGIAFDLPGGMPAAVEPYQTTSFDVMVSGTYGGVPVSGSGLLYYSINGAPYESAPMTEIDTDHYQAELPALSCGDKIKYYVAVDEVTNGTFCYPDTLTPVNAITATEIVVAMTDDFEIDNGWTVSGSVADGQWERGVPAGGGQRGDPPTDFDGSGSCYLTDNLEGNSDVDDGTTSLISPSIDLSAADDASIQYARWYSNNFGDNAFTDTMKVFISNDDGQNWTMVEMVGPHYQATGGWYQHSFYLSDFVTPSGTVKLRFDAADVGEGAVVEAAVDAITINACNCDAAFICGDIDGDDTVNLLDVIFLINYLYKEGTAPNPPERGDLDGSGAANMLDITMLINYLYNEGPAPTCM